MAPVRAPWSLGSYMRVCPSCGGARVRYFCPREPWVACAYVCVHASVSNAWVQSVCLCVRAHARACVPDTWVLRLLSWGWGPVCMCACVCVCILDTWVLTVCVCACMLIRGHGLGLNVCMCQAWLDFPGRAGPGNPPRALPWPAVGREGTLLPGSVLSVTSPTRTQAVAGMCHPRPHAWAVAELPARGGLGGAMCHSSMCQWWCQPCVCHGSPQVSHPVSFMCVAVAHGLAMVQAWCASQQCVYVQL